MGISDLGEEVDLLRARLTCHIYLAVRVYCKTADVPVYGMLFFSRWTIFSGCHLLSWCLCLASERT